MVYINLLSCPTLFNLFWTKFDFIRIVVKTYIYILFLCIYFYLTENYNLINSKFYFEIDELFFTKNVQYAKRDNTYYITEL